MPTSPANSARTCNESLLSRYLESALAADEQSAMENHLTGCEACRATIEMMAADAEFWRAATAALDVPQASVTSRPLSELSLSELVSLSSGLDTCPSELVSGDAHTETTLSRTLMLQRWLDPTIREDSLGRIGKYEVLDVAGEGGMGLVLRAIDTELDRMVALKTLPHHITSRPDARLRLAREARAAAALRHRNIVSVFGLETWRDVPLIVMPLIEGGTLQQYASKQRLTTEQILTTGLQIADALSALHADGIVHRDLKPSNILLQDGLDHVLLTDFGLARFDGDMAITHSDALAGTPFFMSPEQALGKPIDARSDLFSFGSVLYWMCTGKYPFRGSSNYETLSKLVHCEANADELCTQVPGYLQLLIQRLMTKDPNERWSSASEVHELLQKCLVHYRSPSEPLPIELAALSAKRVDRRWPMRAGVALVSLMVAGLGIQQFVIPTRENETGRTMLASSSVSQEAKAQAASTLGESEKTNNQSLRYGALDELDLRVMLSDLKRNEKVHYWLRRLAYLPVEDIPPESISAIQELADHPDLATRELSQVILNKNPFQEVVVLESPKPVEAKKTDTSATENPFQEVLLNE